MGGGGGGWGGRGLRLELADPLLTDGWILAQFLLTEARPIYSHLD